MSSIIIPGFPPCLSGQIDLPDMGELLLSPAFQNIEAEDFMKSATGFQKELLSAIPLKHDRKYVSVRMGVWLLQCGTRSHTDGAGDWHIDGHHPQGLDRDHIVPCERVFIMSSPCTALTEFNDTELSVPAQEDESRNSFINRVRKTEIHHQLAPRAIQPCRIYEFDRHFHRAVEPKRIEFRFFIRIVETDSACKLRLPLKNVSILDLATSQRHVNIAYELDRVSIFLQDRLKAVGANSPVDH